jgi:hypothetical protein
VDTGNLIDRFRDALARENLAEFGECIDRFTAAADECSFPALIAVVRQLEVLLTFHGDLFRRWADEHPEFRETVLREA